MWVRVYTNNRRALQASEWLSSLGARDNGMRAVSTLALWSTIEVIVQRVPMTPRGYRQLQDKLHHLKAVERPSNIEEIEVARAHGDLSENAEYKFAKNRQSEIAAQISYCETRLALAQVIDPSKVSGERVVFGATVDLVDTDTEDEYRYQIVGEDEADVQNKLLSVTSPIAKALIGKEEGDEVRVKTPRGVRQFEIVGVDFIVALSEAGAGK